MGKYVYFFGAGEADGDASQTELLGGKGANLAEMAKLGLPVPPGFTISSECCKDYLNSNGTFPDGLEEEVQTALRRIEKIMGMQFGDPENPLLLSCRSGGRMSMPGMMETVLNVGLCSATLAGLIKKTDNEWFAYDAYRRLIMMYADVVMEKAQGIEPPEGRGIRTKLEYMMKGLKEIRDYKVDTDITAKELKNLCERFKARIEKNLGTEFPDNAQAQLEGAIGAVFQSWNGKRAIAYRRIEGIPDHWGTAVTVQTMVFGNMGQTSATGVAFTRNPATGENKFYGEWLGCAQGEDVVAGTRTPNPLNTETSTEHNRHLPTLEDSMPNAAKELRDIRDKLEQTYRDMLDIEFTIQNEKLFMLQCRVGKRTGTAALNMAMDMLQEGLISETEVVKRLKPEQLDELLHAVVDPKEEARLAPIAKGLPAGPGGATGRIVFTSEDAVKWAADGRNVILVREETNPEDVEGMRAAEGILTARGGMTSHAALVARGWGKCCVVGAGGLKVDSSKRELKIGDQAFKEGSRITLNGTRGLVYAGRLGMIDARENERFKTFMEIVDKYRTMGVRTNAETPEDAKLAREFGAEGIGLFRTEHMFYGSHSEEPLFLLRKMILSDSKAERRKALEELFPFMKADIKNTLTTMDGLPVTIRLLDPPLHEFVPHTRGNQALLAKALDIDLNEIRNRGEALQESNPMMGHRGVRLSITYPEITEMQIRAIFEATAELLAEGHDPMPEIMVPVTCDARELDITKVLTDRILAEVLEKFKLNRLPYKYGTMIEIPRAAFLADEMANTAEFFSFGTNDLTQMTFGFSRDDTGGFMGSYIDRKILQSDPFQTIDQHGVGQLIEISVKKGRQTRPDLKIGICGEQGGDPASVEFCFKNNLDYVSCSPYRIPIARLAAAQAAIKADKVS